MNTTDVLRYDATLDVERLKRMDPLIGDEACLRLRDMNAHADAPAMVAGMRALLPAEDLLAAFSPYECLAAMRDLGLFLGSIKRHGVEPMAALPEAEPVLLELGRRTDMVPRDTVHHYIAWNPDNERVRTYTADPMEVRMMSAARHSLPRLGEAVAVCERMWELDPATPEFAEAAAELAGYLKAMEAAIGIILEHVTPEFFARTMRPYFEEVTVAGQVYLGPAAAHVPLSLIDLALWAADHGDAVYEEFWRESQQYGIPPWRALYQQWRKGPSLVTRLDTAFTLVGDAPVPASLTESAEALSRGLRSLVVFRGKHYGVARRAYDEQLRLYSLGSGGGSLDLLQEVLLLSRENANLVRRGLTLNPHAAIPAQRTDGEA